MRRRNTRRALEVAALFPLLALLPSIASANTTYYKVTDLGALPGLTTSVAYGINASGQVVGASYTTLGSSHAFLYSNGAMHDLGSLGGTDVTAYAINSSGQVVGTSSLASGSATRAFLYQNGAMTPVATSGAWSDASDINAAGHIVGRFAIGGASGGYHAFVQTGPTMTDLGVLGGLSSGARDINNAGQVVGFSDAPDPNLGTVPFLYDGTLHPLASFPAGTFNSVAADINDNGQVVGTGSTNVVTQHHAYLNDHGVITPLEPASSTWLYSTASALNNLGQVVGQVGVDSRNSFPFLYGPDGIADINTLLIPSDAAAYRLLTANDINDVGQIVGYGFNPLGQKHALLLTPVPEPAPASTLLCGSLGIMLSARLGLRGGSRPSPSRGRVLL